MDTKLTKWNSFPPQTYGQIEVVNKMNMHSLRMYNSKRPHTWDESFPYVQNRYNKAIDDLISHNIF